MKISSSTVRRLRTERGWSQDQLAVASGLSLRTVQRVEAEGVASLGTAVCLAATYGAKLIDLQEEQPCSTAHPVWTWPGMLLLGIAIITLAVTGESGRPAGLPASQGLAVINISVASLAVVLIAQALVHLFRQRQYIGAGLAVVGMPWATLLGGGAVLALVRGESPSWALVGTGVSGIALVVMAMREFRRVAEPARA
ncbi:MAG: hypothetical protein DCF27_04495 [Lysobacteraceae bacterium]|nr:MAG: hypothetical protein DCF27_04495 [Xanthomonadaceae bacterium]